MGQRSADEIAAQRQHHGQGGRPDGFEYLVDEAAPVRLIGCERIQLLPLVGDEEQAVGARLLPEHALDDVTQLQVALPERPRLLGDLDQPVCLGHVRLEQRDQGRGQSMQGAVAGDDRRDLPDPIIPAPQPGQQSGAHH